MGTYLKLTAIITMLMGLQLFNLAEVSARPQDIVVPNNIESQGLLTNNAALKSFGKVASKPSPDDYVPPDNKGPSRSQGTGRRLR